MLIECTVKLMITTPTSIDVSVMSVTYFCILVSSGNHNPGSVFNSLWANSPFRMTPHLQVLTDASAMYSPAHTYTQAARRWLVPITVHIAGCHGTQNFFPIQYIVYHLIKNSTRESIVIVQKPLPDHTIGPVLIA